MKLVLPKIVLEFIVCSWRLTKNETTVLSDLFDLIERVR